MPTYEYECQQCTKVFEYTHGIKEPPKTRCEECGGRLERLISRTSFVLKGGGWYKDLYSSPSHKSETKTAAAGTESAAASTPATTTTTTTTSTTTTTTTNASPTGTSSSSGSSTAKAGS